MRYLETHVRSVEVEMADVRRIGMLGLLAAAGLLAGCTAESEEELDLSRLPYLKHTRHPELRKEYDRLLAQRSLPWQLGEEDAGGLTVRERAQRLAGELNQLCTPQNVRLALESIDLFYPGEAFQFDPLRMQKARRSLHSHASLVTQYRRVMQQPDFAFYISVGEGLLADLTVLDHARLAHRLEALAAADALAEGELGEVLSAVRNMLRIDGRLSQLPLVAARSTVVLLRQEALQVVAELVRRPGYDARLHAELIAILAWQREQWPSDQVVWVGDRALGIHAYEMVRDGRLLSVLTKQEIEDLESESNLQAFDEAVRESIDDDEWFYLSSMRRVIEACAGPYYGRIETFAQINARAKQLEGTPRSPLLATNLLLRDLAEVQRALALDQARCEAWLVAARAAVGTDTGPVGLNPVTGKSYDFARRDDTIEVYHLAGELDQDVAIVIPIPQ